MSAQNNWSLLHRDVESEVVPACKHLGLGVLPYSPLASGLLTGKVGSGGDPPTASRLSESRFAKELTPERFDKIESLAASGWERGRPLLEVALSWLASHQVVAAVITGATSPEQVRRNIQSTKTDLTEQDLAQVSDLVLPASVSRQRL